MRIVSIFTSEGACVARVARVASSFRSRLLGLLNRSSLHRHEALLLSPGGSIHTLGMRFAIDVVFLDRDLCVLGTAQRIRPWRGVIAPSGTSHVLELREGRIAELQLEVGARLRQA